MRSGTGIGVRRTATPRCSGRAEPIRGRADSLSGEDLDDVCSALDLAVEALDGVAAAGSWSSAPRGGRVVAKAVGSGSASAGI